MHARVTWRGDEVVVEDLDSTNGVLVDGKRVDVATLAPPAEVVLGQVRLIACVSTFASVEHDRDEAPFTQHVEGELLRAGTFRRPFAMLAVRWLGADRLGWERRVSECLRPVDKVLSASVEVALVALAETAREELSSWAAKLRSAMPDCELRFGAALYPEHGGDSDNLIRAALDALKRAPTDEVCCPSITRSSPSSAENVIVESPSMKELYDLVTRVARTRMPVLILGETGVGKELVARAVHDASPRANAAFCPISCATIPATLTESALFGHEKGAFTGASSRVEGIFEQADGGTVFLDEVGELPPPAQAALLRVLETGRITRVGGTREITVDVRVVAATHRDLASMVTEGLFREDLLYRLDAMTLEVRPLRERVEDIVPLARSALRRAAEQWETPALDFEPAVLDAFCAYRWPGNVRQLRNVVDRAAAIAVGARVTLADLSREIANASGAELPTTLEDCEARAGRNLTERVSAFEREILRDALARAGGSNGCTSGLVFGTRPDQRPGARMDRDHPRTNGRHQRRGA